MQQTDGPRTVGDLLYELQRGGRYVAFDYVISVLVVTFRRSSRVQFLAPGERHFGKALPFIALTLLLGWWGIPWGPIWTVAALVRNLRGGRDVTEQLLAAANVPVVKDPNAGWLFLQSPPGGPP